MPDLGPAGSQHDATQANTDELRAHLRALNEELTVARRRLASSTSDTRPFERRLNEAQAQVEALAERNEKLVTTLRDARGQLLQLKEEVDRLAQPPSGYGVFIESGPEGTVEVYTSGRRMRLAASPSVTVAELTPGQQLRLNEALTVVESGAFELVGEVSSLREVLSGNRALVVGHADEERVVRLASPLLMETLKPGDSLLVDSKAG
ncbi:MAG: proteasome ATPase, partial [Nakamurella sp.]